MGRRGRVWQWKTHKTKWVMSFLQLGWFSQIATCYEERGVLGRQGKTRTSGMGTLRETCKMSGRTGVCVWVCGCVVWSGGGYVCVGCGCVWGCVCVCVWCGVGAGAGNRAACTRLSGLHPQLPPLPGGSCWGFRGAGCLVWSLATSTWRATSGCSTARPGRQHLPGRAWLPAMSIWGIRDRRDSEQICLVPPGWLKD